MLFDLAQLVQQVPLLIMDDPFSEEEIKAALADMPSDHAPGPDGFNGAYMKKCWYIIQGDFKRMCHDFANGTLNIQSINGSFIVLIPKDNPTTVNYYRPISPLNSALKLLTKLLANRL